MAVERLTESLQESVLAVLAFDDKMGGLIAAQVQPENFDGIYHEVAQAVIAYRRKYTKAPGRTHLEDLFSRAKLDPSDRKTHALRRTLINLSQLAEGINAAYVASRAQDFVREQRLKTALLAANERYAQGGDGTVEDTEALLNAALRFRQQTMDAGTFLSEVEKSSAFSPRDELLYPLNIPEFDNLGIGLVQKRMWLYIGPKNTGKSWACVHVGRQGLVNKQRVLHISLEMDEPEVLDRYYQSLFGLATRPDSFNRASLEFDELDRLTGFKVRKAKPKMDFRDPGVKRFLRTKMKTWGTRLNRLVIKAFPSGTLTMAQLRGYLDYLELTHHFIPTVLIVDYPDLFKLSTREFRLDLGRVFVDLRGLLGERNMAGFMPTQSGRDTIGAARNSSKNVTEDISKVFTADTVTSYSQTVAEYERGLARLTVDHARHAPRGTQILLAQSYSTGQYVLQSARMTQAYWQQLKDVAGDEPIED